MGKDFSTELVRKTKDQEHSDVVVLVKDRRAKRTLSSAVRDIIEEYEQECEQINESEKSSTASFKIPSSISKLKERRRSSSNDEKRANVIVTGGALIFLLLAATLVTASFLISPVIETIFSKKLRDIYLYIIL